MVRGVSGVALQGCGKSRVKGLIRGVSVVLKRGRTKTVE